MMKIKKNIKIEWLKIYLNTLDIFFIIRLEIKSQQVFYQPNLRKMNL